jgi:hypothetical protein
LNTESKNKLFVFIGIIGALTDLFGFTQTTQGFYVLGSVFLLITALHFKLFYFIALEIILIAGHGAVVLGIGPTLQAALPALLCLQLLVYYLLSGQLNNIVKLIGIAGIALLSIGFSFNNEWVFFFGSLAISIFSAHHVYYKNRVALIWLILNIMFVLIAVKNLMT